MASKSLKCQIFKCEILRSIKFKLQVSFTSASKVHRGLQFWNQNGKASSNEREIWNNQEPANVADILVSLTLPPTAYRILWLRYHGRSHFWLYIVIDHLLKRTYRGHMSKFRLKSQKLNEILKLENLETTRFFSFVDTRKLA